MMHDRSVPPLLKIITYIIFFLFLFFQVTYVKAFDTARNLLSNYTLIKKYSNPEEYNNKIIYISSGKPIYQSYYDSDFNMRFKMILIRKTVRHCIVKESRRDDGHREETHEWVSYQEFSRYYYFEKKTAFTDYEKYFDFKIGNYTIVSNTFKNLGSTDYIPPKIEIDRFLKSRASLDLIYLGEGYFFDRHFPDHRNLYTRLHSCRNQDTYVKFEIYNPKKVSVFGLVIDGKIFHADFLKYDFSVIFNGKISPNQFVADSVFRERTKTIVSGILVIIFLIVLFFHYHRSFFSILSLSFLILITFNIRSYYMSNFPIKFKYVIFYSVFALVIAAFYFNRQISQLISIFLMS